MKMFRDLPPFPGGVKSRVAEEREAELRTAIQPKNKGLFDNPVVWMHNGQERNFYYIGTLAAALERKPVTIRSWETKGIIPMSRFREPAPETAALPEKSAAGRRLYTREQIEAVRAAAVQCGVLDRARPTEAALTAFSKAVRAAWSQLD